jgi:hypothetical protein
MTVHQGGATSAAAHPSATESVAAGHAQPQSVMSQPIAIAWAPAAQIQTRPILVGLSSSRHHREEHHGVEIQRWECAPVTLCQVRMGADLARPSYIFGRGCLAFTDGLCRVTWPCKFRPGI